MTPIGALRRGRSGWPTGERSRALQASGQRLGCASEAVVGFWWPRSGPWWWRGGNVVALVKGLFEAPEAGIGIGASVGRRIVMGGLAMGASGRGRAPDPAFLDAQGGTGVAT